MVEKHWNDLIVKSTVIEAITTTSINNNNELSGRNTLSQLGISVIVHNNNYEQRKGSTEHF